MYAKHFDNIGHFRRSDKPLGLGSVALRAYYSISEHIMKRKSAALASCFFPFSPFTPSLKCGQVLLPFALYLALSSPSYIILHTSLLLVLHHGER
jgi:hypothetical protein